MFLALAGIFLLIHAGAAAGLLVRANLDRRRKAAFAAAAFVSITLKAVLAMHGHNYDVDSYGIVASLVLGGKSVYADTARYNYAPLWSYVLAGLKQFAAMLPALGAEVFHVAVASFLAVVDVALAAILATQFSFAAGIFLLCCPATILLTGYHSQFENFALFAGLAGWILIRTGAASTRRVVTAAGLQGLSLAIKHVLFLFPLWVLLWPKLGSLRKRAAYVVVAYGIFGLSFLPWMFDTESRAGIIRNVFHYRSEFNLSLSRLIFSLHPFAMPSPPTASFLTLGWIAAVIAIGAFTVRQDCDLFPIYLLAMFALSPALMDQYLAIAVLAAAILCAEWPAWPLLGTILIALLASPADIFRVPFNFVYYIAMVSTQVCAFALLVVKLRSAVQRETIRLPAADGVKRALSLAAASLGMVWIVFFIKLVAFHGSSSAPPLVNRP